MKEDKKIRKRYFNHSYRMNKDHKKFTRVCPICSNYCGEILHHQSFVFPENYQLPKEYDVVCCKNCGFVYADTPANQQDYNRYYQQFSNYEDLNISSGSGNTEWEMKRLKRTASDISNYLYDKNASILDIGCANGGLLVELKKLGYNNLTGLDPSINCVQNVMTRDIIAFKGGVFSINSSISSNKNFDCIILSHVLEHIYDLKLAVSCIVEKLNNNGILYIEVPDASDYINHYIVPYYYFDCEHINHFDENSLNNLFFQNNFDLLYYAKKEIYVSNNKLYPAIYALYKKRARVNYKIVSSSKVRNNIISYIEKSRNCDKWPEVDKLAFSQKEIVVWGAGSYTSRLLANSSLAKCNIVAFIDKNRKKQGNRINNIPIYPPSDILKKHKGPIIICSALFSDEIMKEIEDMYAPANNNIIIMK